MNAKVHPSRHAEILADYQNGVGSQREIGEKYGLGQRQVSNIVRRVGHRPLTPAEVSRRGVAARRRTP